MNNSGGWLASHPGTEERVRKNREALAAHPGSGYVGEAEYRSKTRAVRAMAPAYELYEKGLEALAKKNFSEALRLSMEARSLEPREALFYGLSARAHAGLGKTGAAAQAWDQAVQRNPGYFYFWLERGLLREKAGDEEGAREDLKQSFRLLPTQQAKDALARLGG
jgi:tetratricopeptide (TPR) repeat protein